MKPSVEQHDTGNWTAARTLQSSVRWATKTSPLVCACVCVCVCVHRDIQVRTSFLRILMGSSSSSSSSSSECEDAEATLRFTSASRLRFPLVAASIFTVFLSHTHTLSLSICLMNAHRDICVHFCICQYVGVNPHCTQGWRWRHSTRCSLHLRHQLLHHSIGVSLLRAGTGKHQQKKKNGGGDTQHNTQREEKGGNRCGEEEVKRGGARECKNGGTAQYRRDREILEFDVVELRTVQRPGEEKKRGNKEAIPQRREQPHTRCDTPCMHARSDGFE